MKKNVIKSEVIYNNIDDIFSEMWISEGNNLRSSFANLFYELSGDAKLIFLQKNICSTLSHIDGVYILKNN